MATLQMKHTNSTDILFPEEESAQAMNDSFYSQPSTSSYSTYSQEVKYIFNPKVANRGPPSESNYSEIDHLSVSSNRNSADIGREHRKDMSTKHSPCSAGSSPAAVNQRWTPNHSAPLSIRDINMNSKSEPVTDPKYGLSIKPVRHPPHHNSVDSLNFWHQNGNSDSSKIPQRQHSADGMNAQPKSEQRPPPYRSISSESSPRYPPRTGPLPNPKTPPKPKRLHQMNSTPDRNGNQPPGQEIYATPVLNARMFKSNGKQSQHPSLPPPPPPPPYPKPQKASQPTPPKPHQIAEVSSEDFENFASRRRTWSPPTFNRMFSTSAGSQLQAMRCYRSNEQLDVPNENTYEDLDTISNSSAPPKLTPQSGKLSKVPHERIIKPIAFKPILSPQSRYTPQRPSPPSCQRPSPPSSLRPGPFPAFPMSPRHATATDQPAMQLANHSHDDGYMSQDGNHSHQNSGMNPLATQNAPVPGADSSLDRSRSASGSGSYPASSQSNSQVPYPVAGQFKTNGSDARSDSYASSSRVSSNPGADISMTTPSPSDSGVGEMEAILRSKDTEIAHLRDTMAKNESAIMQVHEEKRQNWQLEIRDYAQEWDRRLRGQQQKASKTEQALLVQLFKLQQERKALKLEVDKHCADKEKSDKKCSELSSELITATGKVEELQWDLHNKNGELAMVKAQLKDAKDDTSTKTTDLVGLRSQVRELSQERDRRTEDIDKLQQELAQSREDFQKLQGRLDTANLELEKSKQLLVEQKQSDSANNNSAVSVLETELCRLRTEFGSAKTSFQHERELWLEEKNKVIRYQKHLQLNYVQMMRKNKMLEAEIEQLTMELENRDIKLMNDGLVVTEEESVC